MFILNRCISWKSRTKFLFKMKKGTELMPTFLILSSIIQRQTKTHPTTVEPGNKHFLHLPF